MPHSIIFVTMARDKDLLAIRDQKLRRRYDEVSEKNPKWRHGEVLKTVAQEFFISTRTASAIFNCEGAYGQTT